MQSILSQTLKDLELILVDDGTGADLAVLEADGFDPRLRLIALPANRGAAFARNAALAQARGEFVALLDHDDIALPVRLEAQVALLRAVPSVGLVSCRADRIDVHGTVTGPEFALGGERGQQVFSNYSMPAPASSYTGRREIFERFSFRPELTFAEDFDFVARAAEVTAIRGVSEVLLHYRHHGDQITQTRLADQTLHACLGRLLTARRRAGRAENFSELMAAYARWLQTPPATAVSYAHFSRLCLEEGFPLLAVYLARHLVSVRREICTVVTAAGILQRALWLAPQDSVRLTRMFFSGPLRTHGLASA